MDKLDEYYELYEERASIAQYDGNIGQILAEKRAFYEVVNIYRNNNNYGKYDEKVGRFEGAFRDKINRSIGKKWLIY